MIVKMRRLTLLVLDGERAKLLKALLHLGCVELRAAGGGEGEAALGLLRAERSALQEVRREEASLRQAAAYLKQCGVSFPLLQKRPRMEETALWDRSRLKKVLSGAPAVNEYGRAIEDGEREIVRLRERAAALAHWRPYPLPLENGGTEHVRLLLGTLPVKLDFGDFSLALEEAVPSAEAFLMESTREHHYAAVIYHRSCRTAAEQVLREHGFRAAALGGGKGTAAEQIAAAEKRCAALEKELKRRRELIASYGVHRGELELAFDQVRQRLLLEEAKERALSDGTVTLLRGWIPAEREEALAALLAPFACAWETAEPEEDDTPPTLLKNPKWMRPINVVTEMYSLPDYRGIDPNPLIFWFYVFFFGLMFADVAYGLILFFTALFVMKRWDPRGAVGQLMHLGLYLGASTFVCGIFTGGFFGNAIEVVAATFFGLPMEALPLWVQRFSAGLLFNPLTSPMAVLFATLAIGAVQLVFGQLVHIYMEARSGRPLDGILDTAPWWVFFAGSFLWLSGRSPVLFLLGVVLLVATQGRKKRGLRGKLLGGVASLYSVTNWLSDVLSYSRLMALMLATSVIATVINTLGALPGSIIAFVPIFIIGHLFNIAVNLIGTYVHAARLQYLEFYGKFYKEGGVPFRPLTYETKYVDVIKEEKS